MHINAAIKVSSKVLQKLCRHLVVAFVSGCRLAMIHAEYCRFTACVGGRWSNTHKAQVTWGAAMRQYWHSRPSVHSMPGTVHTSLESRSHGSQNTLQCMWSPLDEAQQAQMRVKCWSYCDTSANFTRVVSSTYCQKQLHCFWHSVSTYMFRSNNVWYTLIAAKDLLLLA